jgi:hypothetical protein
MKIKRTKDVAGANKRARLNPYWNGRKYIPVKWYTNIIEAINACETMADELGLVCGVQGDGHNFYVRVGFTQGGGRRHANRYCAHGSSPIRPRCTRCGLGMFLQIGQYKITLCPTCRTTIS